MGGIWVLFELVPVAALTLLVCVAVLAHGREPVEPADWEHPTVHAPLDVRDDDAEPDWWPEFEREFALYVATTAPTRNSEAAAPSHAKRPGRRA